MELKLEYFLDFVNTNKRLPKFAVDKFPDGTNMYIFWNNHKGKMNDYPYSILLKNNFLHNKFKEYNKVREDRENKITELFNFVEKYDKIPNTYIYKFHDGQSMLKFLTNNKNILNRKPFSRLLKNFKLKQFFIKAVTTKLTQSSKINELCRFIKIRDMMPVPFKHRFSDYSFMYSFWIDSKYKLRKRQFKKLLDLPLINEYCFS